MSKKAEDIFNKLAADEEVFLKSAVIGPLGDVSALGIPSLIGYELGRTSGSQIASGDRKDSTALGSTARLLLVPGALGYTAGKRKGKKDYRNKFKNKDMSKKAERKDKRDEAKFLALSTLAGASIPTFKTINHLVDAAGDKSRIESFNKPYIDTPTRKSLEAQEYMRRANRGSLKGRLMGIGAGALTGGAVGGAVLGYNKLKSKNKKSTTTDNKMSKKAEQVFEKLAAKGKIRHFIEFATGQKKRKADNVARHYYEKADELAPSKGDVKRLLTEGMGSSKEKEWRRLTGKAYSTQVRLGDKADPRKIKNWIN